MFVPSLVEIGPVALEKKMKWKVYDNNDEKDDYDNDGQWTNCDHKVHLSLQLRWAKKQKTYINVWYPTE